jgi:hypothetical protein
VRTVDGADDDGKDGDYVQRCDITAVLVLDGPQDELAYQSQHSCVSTDFTVISKKAKLKDHHQSIHQTRTDYIFRVVFVVAFVAVALDLNSYQLL